MTVRRRLREPTSPGEILRGAPDVPRLGALREHRPLCRDGREPDVPDRSSLASRRRSQAYSLDGVHTIRAWAVMRISRRTQPYWVFPSATASTVRHGPRRGPPLPEDLALRFESANHAMLSLPKAPADANCPAGSRPIGADGNYGLTRTYLWIRRGRDSLKEGEAGIPIAEPVREHGISRATYCNWRSKYAGTSVCRAQAAEGARGGEHEAEADVCRTRAGERRPQGCPEPNTVTLAARRQAIEVLTTEHRLSVRRACRVVGPGPGGVVCPAGGRHREGRGSDRGPPAGAVAANPRWGFWTCYDRLRLDGHVGITKGSTACITPSACTCRGRPDVAFRCACVEPSWHRTGSTRSGERSTSCMTPCTVDDDSAR